MIDATHPYAAVGIGKMWAAACEAGNSGYVRLIRGSSAESVDQAVLVGSVDEAVEYLKKTEGNILLRPEVRNCLNIHRFLDLRRGYLQEYCLPERWQQPVRSWDLWVRI